VPGPAAGTDGVRPAAELPQAAGPVTGAGEAGRVPEPLLPGLAAHPRGAAMLGAVFISFSGIIFRFSGVAPTTATFWRSALAVLPLWLLGRVEDRRFGPRTRRERRWAVVAGLFFAADLQCFHYAVTLVGAGLGTVVPNLQVVVVALATWLLFGERPSARALAAIPVVLVGVVLISGVLDAAAYGENPVAGAILGVAAGVFYAGFLIVMRRVNRDGRRAAGPLGDATLTTALAVVPVGLLLGSLDLAPAPAQLTAMALLALTSQVLGYLFITMSLPRLPATVGSILLFVQPVATLVFAALLLGERPSPMQLAGVALVLGGVAFAAVPTSRRAPDRPAA
jgi:drug/metabolite transporter (DMT)-like permease